MEDSKENIAEAKTTPVQKLMHPMRRLYDWTISWANTPYGLIALAVLSFMESSFFPIPPDVLLIPLVLGARRKWFRIALVCTISSVLGGIFGWVIGRYLWDILAPYFFTYIPGFTEELFLNVKEQYNNNAFLAIFGAGLTPIPYKIFTIASGVFNVELSTLVIASVLGRGARFFAVALVIYLVGPKAKALLDKYFNLIAIAFFVLLVLGFVAIKFLVK